jgi:hypothetical protein
MRKEQRHKVQTIKLLNDKFLKKENEPSVVKQGSNLDSDINFKNMYNYQSKGLITKNDNYDKYIKYLQFFFQKNYEKDKYTKDFMDGSYILIDKRDPKKRIEITPSRFINIHKFYLELKNQIDVILLKFFSFIESKDNFTNENREEFDVLKKKYTAYKEKIEEINLINIDFYKEIDLLNLQKIEKTNDLIIRYKKKLEVYSQIKTMIPEQLKTEMIQMFAKNKMSQPDNNHIRNLAKANNIPANDIELWFSWIEENYYYLLLKHELSKINSSINAKELGYDLNTKYFIIKKPIIKE